MPGRTWDVKLDIRALEHQYFYFDIPVDYTLSNQEKIKIYPVKVIDSEYFLSSIDIFQIDKNSMPDAKIISMPYLQFLTDYVLKEEVNIYKLYNLLFLCLQLKNPTIKKDVMRRYYIEDIGVENKLIIPAADFENIRRIILYQNILHYDDDYINPELKKSMQEVDMLKSKDIDFPTIERKISIISSHTGIPKQQQLEMTMRAHEGLFEAVRDEVEFTTVRPISIYAGSEIEHWIYKKKKNKLEGYITDVQDYQKSMGGQQMIHSNTNNSEQYLTQFENFNK